GRQRGARRGGGIFTRPVAGLALAGPAGRPGGGGPRVVRGAAGTGCGRRPGNLGRSTPARPRLGWRARPAQPGRRRLHRLSFFVPELIVMHRVVSQKFKRGLSLAAVAAAALIAGCGGGGTSQIDPFSPTRVIAFGDESGAILQSGKKYTIN